MPWLLLLIAAATVCRFFHGVGTTVEAVESVGYVQQRGSASARFSTHQDASFWRTADFTLGFQRVADADEYLLCIWMSADLNQTALWWPSAADFGLPALLPGENSDGDLPPARSPTVANGTIFSFTSNGSLQLISGDGGSAATAVIWSVGNNNASVAELENTGNLVLRDEFNATVWQSFGDLRDTMIFPAGGSSPAYVKLVMNKTRLLQSRSSSNQSSRSYVAGRFHAETDSNLKLELHAVEKNYGIDFLYTNGSISVYPYLAVSKKSRSYNENGSMEMSLVKLDPDANLRVYVWSETGRVWRAAWQLLERKCFLGGPCGPFGICKESDTDGTPITCRCPQGYSFLDPSDASKGCRSDFNFTSICSSTSTSNNGTSPPSIIDYNASSYTMSVVPNSDYDYNNINNTYQQTVATYGDCSRLCLQLCICAAAFFVSSNGHCYLKGNQTGGILMNGYMTKPSSDVLLLKLPASYDLQEGGGRPKGSIGGGLIAAGVVVVVLLIGATTAAVMVWRRRSGAGGGVLLEMEGDGKPVVRFTQQQLAEATDNFRHLLGEGGFGKVYKGWMKQKKKKKKKNADAADTTHKKKKKKKTSGGYCRGGGGKAVVVEDDVQLQEVEVVMKVVAVKVLKKSSDGRRREGDDVDVVGELRAARQFAAEVSTLGNIHHVNLVNLIGYCHEEEKVDVVGGGRQTSMRALVFEFMEGGSLDRYLSSPSSSSSSGGGGKKKTKKNNGEEEELSWERRYSIALGMARGIAYLHHECQPPILHSDIKPQNVLLDGQFAAKVADFGFARRFQETKSHLTMSGMQGTRGYMAPEWLKTDAITSKVDVYSFGVVLLELVRGLCERYRHLLLLLHNHPDDHGSDQDQGDVVDLRDRDLPVIDWAYRYLQCLLLSSTPANDESAAAGLGKRPPVNLLLHAAATDCEQQQKMRLLKVGLWCVQAAPKMRPSMLQVLRMMETAAGGDIDTSPLLLPPLPLHHHDEAGVGVGGPPWSDDDAAVAHDFNPLSTLNDSSISFFSNFVEQYSTLSAR